MSTNAQSLIASFDSLSPDEQREVAAEIVRRAPQPEAHPVESGESAAPCPVAPSAEEEETDILPPDEWVKRFRAWARSHPSIRNPNLDDSREAMYEGCGE